MWPKRPFAQRIRRAFVVLLAVSIIGPTTPAWAADFFGDNYTNTVTGTAQADTIWTYGGSDTINGLGGDDTLYGGAEPDTIDGGDGDDLIYGETYSNESQGGTEIIHGGEGNDTVFAGYTSIGGGENIVFGDGGDDVLLGSPLGDDLQGGDGKDSLHGYEGPDTLSGGPGDDALFGYSGNDSIMTGTGSDVVLAGPGDDFVTVTSTGATAVYGEDGNDAIQIQGGSAITYGFGGPGQDFLQSTSSGQNILLGGVGNDTIWGSHTSTVDALYGDEGDDVLDGLKGVDYLFGGAGDDSLNGGIDEVTDVLLGGEGNDRLLAEGPGTDVFYGEGGDDVIDTVGKAPDGYGRGVDYVFPGAGSNSVHIDEVTIIVNAAEGSALLLRTRQAASTARWHSVPGYDLLTIGTQAVWFVGSLPNRASVSIVNPAYVLVDSGRTLKFIGGGQYQIQVIESWNGRDSSLAPTKLLSIDCSMNSAPCPVGSFRDSADLYLFNAFRGDPSNTLLSDPIVSKTYSLIVKVSGATVGSITFRTVLPEDLRVGDEFLVSESHPFGATSFYIRPNETPSWSLAQRTPGNTLSTLGEYYRGLRIRVDSSAWNLPGWLITYEPGFNVRRWDVGVNTSGQSYGFRGP